MTIQKIVQGLLVAFWITVSIFLIHVEVQEGDTNLSFRTVHFTVLSVLSIVMLLSKREVQTLLILSWGIAALVIFLTVIIMIGLQIAGFTVNVNPEIANMMWGFFGCGTLMVAVGRIILL